MSHVAAVSEVERYLSVHRERGVLELCFRVCSGAQIVLMRPGKPPQELPLPDDLASEFDPDKPFTRQMHRVFAGRPVGECLFNNAILGKASAEPSFYDGYKAQQVVDAAIEPAETWRRVALVDA